MGFEPKSIQNDASESEVIEIEDNSVDDSCCSVMTHSSCNGATGHGSVGFKFCTPVEKCNYSNVSADIEYSNNCLYCNKKTTQRLGLLTHICEDCGNKQLPKSFQNTTSNVLFQLKVNHSLIKKFKDSNSLHSCMGCTELLPYSQRVKELKGYYHNVGRFRFCFCRNLPQNGVAILVQQGSNR